MAKSTSASSWEQLDVSLPEMAAKALVPRAVGVGGAVTSYRVRLSTQMYYLRQRTTRTTKSFSKGKDRSQRTTEKIGR